MANWDARVIQSGVGTALVQENIGFVPTWLFAVAIGRPTSSSAPNSQGDGHIMLGMTDFTNHANVANFHEDNVGSSDNTRGVQDEFFHMDETGANTIAGDLGSFSTYASGYQWTPSSAFDWDCAIMVICGDGAADMMPWSHGGGATDVVSHSLGVVPDALITFNIGRGGTANYLGNSAAITFGVATSTTVGEQWVIGCSDRNNQAANADKERWGEQDYCGGVMDSFNGAIQQRMQCTGLSTTTFTMTRSGSTTGFGYFTLVLGGIVAKSGVVATINDITTKRVLVSSGDALDPGVALFASVFDEDTGGSPADVAFGIGIASSATNRFAQSLYIPDAVDPSDVFRRTDNASIYQRPVRTTGALEASADISDWASENVQVIMDDAEPGAGDVAMLGYVVMGDVPAVGGGPKGPLGHPFHGPFAGPLGG